MEVLGTLSIQDFKYLMGAHDDSRYFNRIVACDISNIYENALVISVDSTKENVQEIKEFLTRNFSSFVDTNIESWI